MTPELSIELFGGDNFLQRINQHLKNTHADKGFSLWHSLSSMFAHIVLELPQTHCQGLPIDSSKAYFSHLDLSNHGFFSLLVGMFLFLLLMLVGWALHLCSKFKLGSKEKDVSRILFAFGC